jgi:hypothetical protein
MRLDGSHSGRFGNFGQFCLFEENNSCRNKKVADPIGYNVYSAEVDLRHVAVYKSSPLKVVDTI